MSKTFVVNSVEGLSPVVNYLVDLTKTQQYFLFNAPMGAGKTTFIAKVCEKLGVKDAISSPTYAIVNEYETETSKTIYHFDLYRLNDEMELLDIGIEDMLDNQAFCFIEWPEKILNFLPLPYVEVNIQIQGETRVFTIETTEKDSK